MIVVPAAIAVTAPLAFTVATLVLPDVQLIVLSVALDGEMVVVSADVCPGVSDRLVGLNVIPVTGTVTEIAQIAILLPSTVITVMVVVPAPTAVTRPLLLIEAMLVLPDVQLNDWFVAFNGNTVATNAEVLPTVNDKLEELSVTPVTGIVKVDNVRALLAAEQFPAASLAFMVME